MGTGSFLCQFKMCIFYFEMEIKSNYTPALEDRCCSKAAELGMGKVKLPQLYQSTSQHDGLYSTHWNLVR